MAFKNILVNLFFIFINLLQDLFPAILYFVFFSYNL